MLKAYILACLAVASSIPLKLHSISHLSTISKSIPSFHFTKAKLLLYVYWQMHTHAIFFVLKKIQKIANPTMHLLNPLQAPCYFVHSIQSHTCPILPYPIILLKENKYACGRFFHSDALRFGRSLLSFAPDPYTPLHLHSISHLSSKSKSASHPCPDSAYPHHSVKCNIHFL
jgi:hypothetical protein